jgi:predicted nucleotidyltransferase
VDLLVAFGSAVRPDGPARDLDLAVRFGRAAADLLGLLDELAALAGTDRIDLMNLAAAACTEGSQIPRCLASAETALNQRTSPRGP